MLALLLLGVVVAIVAIALLTPRPDTGRSSRPTDPWMNRARSLVVTGRTLADEVSSVAPSTTTRHVPDQRLCELGERIDDFERSVAPVSACAPTVMDARVCRSVALRAHALGGAIERELRRREIVGSDDHGGVRPDIDLQPLVSEFTESISDLDTHLELL